MIGYPFTWKAQLKHQLRETQAYLRRSEATRRNGPEFEDASAWLEYLVLIAAFTARRLIEAEALSPEVRAKTIPISRFPRRPDAPALHFRNRQEVGLHYALNSPKDTSIDLRELCNTLIHSYLLMDCTTSANPGELTGLIVTADRTSSEYCFLIELDDLLAVIEAVANDGFDTPYEP